MTIPGPKIRRPPGDDGSDRPRLDLADLVSLFQTNSRALEVEREINWEVARDGAVQYVSDANYGPSGSSCGPPR